MSRPVLFLVLLVAGSLLGPAFLQQTGGSHLTGPVVGVWSDTYKSSIISDPLLTQGSRFPITVNVTEVTGLTSYDITLRYFSDVLTTQTADVNLLPVEGKSFNLISKFVDDATGTVRIIAGLGGGDVTVATSSALFVIEFSVDRVGITSLSLTVKLSVLIGIFPQTIEPELVSGSFTNTGARPPIASFKYNWTDTFPDGLITQGEIVTFDASASYDPDAPQGAPNNGIVSYQWSFGDDTTTAVAQNPVIAHIFQDRVGNPRYGEFTVTLTVFDDPDEPGSSSKKSERLTVARLPTHDLRVDCLEGTNPARATHGEQLTFRVSARNLGTFTENFTVTLFVESILVGSQSFANVGPDQTKTGNFTWDTQSVEPAVHRVKADVTIVAGEESKSDNSCSFFLEVLSGENMSSILPYAVGGVLLAGLVAGVVVYIIRRGRTRRAEA